MKASLIVNKSKKHALETAQRVVSVLTEAGAEVLTCADCPVVGTTVADTADEIIRDCDITVTVGGDGTIIHHAKLR